VSGEGTLVTAPEGTAQDVAEAFAQRSPESSRTRTIVWQDPVPTAAAGATMTGMEYMTAVVTGAVPPPPIAVTMRLRPVELEEGRVVFEGEPGEEHYNPIGVVHGDPARLRSRLRRSHHVAGRCRLHLARPRGEVRAADHPRHRPRPLRGEGPLRRPPAGDGRGQPHRCRERQAARARDRHLHDLERLETYCLHNTIVGCMADAGNLLRTVRKRHGVSQKSLAIRASTTQSAISSIERGRVSPTVETLGELVFLLGEELLLGARPRDSGVDIEALSERLRLSPTERLQRGREEVERAVREAVQPYY
jgi:transcriptional regulator with XRE-family HTH domain